MGSFSRLNLPRFAMLGVVPALLATTVLPSTQASAASEVTLDGVVRTLAADTVSGDHHGEHWQGHSDDIYQQVLVVGAKGYFLKGKKARTNAHVHVHGQIAGNTFTASTLTQTGTAAGLSDTGTTRVLVMLATWTAPDAVTPASAAAQLFSDSNGWYRDASYGALGQVGDVTPWLTIAPPATGCYNDHLTLMD